MSDEKQTNPAENKDRSPIDTIDAAFFLLSALATAMVSVLTGFIDSYSSLAKDARPFYALGPMALAGGATGIWLRQKLWRKKPVPPRPRSSLATAASIMVIAGVAVLFVGMVKFCSHYRPYLKDLRLNTWSWLLGYAVVGTVLMAAGRIIDRRLRKGPKTGKADA